MINTCKLWYYGWLLHLYTSDVFYDFYSFFYNHKKNPYKQTEERGKCISDRSYYYLDRISGFKTRCLLSQKADISVKYF